MIVSECSLKASRGVGLLLLDSLGIGT
ncbi:hypothetical protein Tco_0649295, partial [Tanacetum coccineum]